MLHIYAFSTLSLLTVPSPKLIKFGKLKKKTVPQLNTAQKLVSEGSHFRGLYIESKVRKLCISQGFSQRVIISLFISISRFIFQLFLNLSMDMC